MKTGNLEEIDFYDRLRGSVFASIVKNLSKNERVLDIGCGDCDLVEYLARKGDMHVIGLDIDGNKFKHTSQKMPREIRTKVKCIKGDAENLKDFGDKSFSAVISLYSLHEIAHPSRALKECRRILKGKGKIIVVDLLENTIAEKLYSEKYFNPEGIKTLMAKAGFKIIKQKIFSSEGPAITVGYKREANESKRERGDRKKYKRGIRRVATGR
jgi:ubiquinone/menaquinone biosynthesis C-methylase UbiE